MSLVLELQSASTDKTNDISDLLRKCLLVATKLKFEEFKTWVNCELHGYQDAEIETPPYRQLRAVMKVFNPYHGLQPFFMPPRLENELCNIEYRSPIGNAVSILESQRGSDDKTPPIFPLPSKMKNFLLENMDLPLEPMRLVSETQLDMVIDAIRSTILEWSLRLEEEGILGEGMAFSKEEKERAAASHQIHIGNFQGVLGNVAGSTVNQNLDMNVAQGDFASLQSLLESKGVSDDDISEIETALKEDPKPASPDSLGPKVSTWMGKMISKAASGAWKVTTTAASKILTEAIGSYYGF